MAEDLKVAPNTVRHYLDILESLHIIFLVRPHHSNIARSIQKMPRLYFFDSGYVNGDEGIRLENTVAVCLRKYADFEMDVNGHEAELRYLRTKDHRDVDFALVRDKKLTHLIEVKMSDFQPTPGLVHFADMSPQATCLQLVHHLRQEETRGRVEIRRLGEWLAGLPA